MQAACYMKSLGWKPSCILSKFWDSCSAQHGSPGHCVYLDSGFQSIVDGKYEEWSTTELSGVACLQYIFQAIFVTSLEVYILLILDTGCYTGDAMSTYLSVLEHVLQICFPMWLVHLLSEVLWKLWEWLCMLIPLYTCILTLTKLSSTTWVLAHV
jgi:hypothetical protein